MSTEREIEFIESIDACFPYENKTEWMKIIDEGILLSDNASFMILHEICRAPNEISPNLLLEIFSYWNSKYFHPLKECISSAAIPIIHSKEIPVEESAQIMNEVRKYSNLYTALSISYFACDDVEEKLDDLYNEITDEWKTSAE